MSAQQVYYVVNWPWHEHRDMKKPPARGRWGWCKAKCGFGDDWQRLMERAGPDALLAAGVWDIVRQIAAMSPYRGLLLRGGHVVEAMTVEMMATRSYADPKSFAKGMEILVEVGWVSNTDADAGWAAVSRRLWAQVYSLSGDIGAGNARKARAKIAPNNNNNNDSKESLEGQTTARISRAAPPDVSDETPVETETPPKTTEPTEPIESSSPEPDCEEPTPRRQMQTSSDQQNLQMLWTNFMAKLRGNASDMSARAKIITLMRDFDFQAIYDGIEQLPVGCKIWDLPELLNGNESGDQAKVKEHYRKMRERFKEAQTA